ncbi:MAG: hypothetical protein V4467_00135 [Patescibacteria group bacterium]
MKLTTPQIAEILVAVIIAVIGWWQYSGSSASSPQTQTSGTGNLTLQQNVVSSPNSTLNQFVDTPAVYTSTYILEKNNNTDWPYKATISILANKSTNLPRILCLKINTDVDKRPESKKVIINVGETGAASVSSGYNGYDACIENPSGNLMSNFLLSQEPSKFDIKLSTDIKN